jgi:hypothetical protein
MIQILKLKKMTKREFNPLIDGLLAKVNSIEFDDYYAALRMISEFRKFVNQYHNNLNQYVLEHIGKIEADFENAKKSKNISEKSKYWKSAINDLSCDIESMKYENKFLND